MNQSHWLTVNYTLSPRRLRAFTMWTKWDLIEAFPGDHRTSQGGRFRN